MKHLIIGANAKQNLVVFNCGQVRGVENDCIRAWRLSYFFLTQGDKSGRWQTWLVSPISLIRTNPN